jgi:hypothetical protein
MQGDSENDDYISQEEEEKPKKKKGKIRYNIRIGFTKLRKIKISVNEIKNDNLLYQRKLDYNDFLELDNYFALYNNIEEIMVELDDLIVDNKIILTPDKDPKKLIFEFDAEVNNKPRRVSITLFKKFNEHMDAINSICKALVAQNQLIDKITSENKDLKEKIIQLDKRVAEKEEEKIFLENDSIKGTKDLDDYDKHSDLIRYEVKIQEHNDDFAFISPKSLEMEKCDPKDVIDNSKILNHYKELSFLIKKINRNISYTSKQFFNMKLLYRASDDGDTAESFHKKCDNISPLLILIKTTKHRRFGGFTQATFESTQEKKGKLDGSAFIFSLDKLKSYDVQEGQNAICTCKDNGPIFYGNESCNIYLSDKFLITKGNVAKRGDRYNTNEDYEINYGKAKFHTQDIEIYHIFLTKLQ